MTKLGFLGAGNMGGAIIRGLSAKKTDISIYAYEKDAEKLSALSQYGVTACKDEKELMLAATRLAEELATLLKDSFSDVQTVVFGPFEAPVYRVDNRYRMRMVVKCRLNKRSRALFATLLATFDRSRGSTSLSIDLNPSTL